MVTATGLDNISCTFSIDDNLISTGRHIIELSFQLALHLRCYKKLDTEKLHP